MPGTDYPIINGPLHGTTCSTQYAGLEEDGTPLESKDLEGRTGSNYYVFRDDVGAYLHQSTIMRIDAEVAAYPDMPGVDSGLARSAYATGYNVLDFAVMTATTAIETAQTVASSRATDPNTFPGFVGETTPDAVARRIIGNLLDAGWIAPLIPSAEQPHPHDQHGS